ncbi:MAG: toprim domain-containing protein, partial [Leptospiraceae bacterium]|nr:toprim domain-containing protein [Leptospiraceae bacterium]
ITNPETINAFTPIFFDESLSKIMPRGHAKSGRELIERLVALGIRHKKTGREIMAGYVAFPAYGEDGSIQQLVARYIGVATHRPRYLLLSLPHAGIFNRPALHAKQIILTEGIMDCMTFYEHGFRNVTCGFGSNGFHEDLLAAFTQHGTETVYIAYDNDESGNAGAAKVAEKLSECGIGVYRVHFPKGMDASDYARKTKPARHALTVLINSAEWIGKGKPKRPMLSTEIEPLKDAGKYAGRPSAKTEADAGNQESAAHSEGDSSRETESKPAEKNNAPTIKSIREKFETPVKQLEGDICELSFGDRLYRVFGLSKNNTLEVMRVNIRAYIEEGYFSETIDLASNKQKDRYAIDAAEALRGKAETFKRDLERMFLKLEDVQYERIYGAEQEAKNKRVEISDTDKEAAFKFLKSKRIFNIIEEDFKKCGVVGEEENLLVMYLAATSRLLVKPIHILIHSSSAAGKSTLMKAVLNLMPPEDVHLYSALTGQALYYMQNKDLKHKILAVEEDRGAERADYIMKMLQTEGKASIATTIKDPGTGHMSASDYWIEGPLGCWRTSTAVWIDEEVLNRFLVIATDESREQTGRILEAQRFMRTLEGWQSREARKEIYTLHQNAQRLLRPLPVINPLAHKLSFLDDRHRLRRDHEKYQSLIEAVALLRQYQKPLQKREIGGKTEECIHVDLIDIRIANRLANHVLGRTLDDLPPHTRTFLSNMAALADEETERQNVSRLDVKLTRRQMMEKTGLSSTQVHHHLGKLIENEYILPHPGTHRRLLVYEILYRGEGQSGKPFLPGIADLRELEKELKETLKAQKELENKSKTENKREGDSTSSVKAASI